ncbi:MAG: hypothetical protein K6D98_00625 [Clostridiales bacterium]|nr:hypothetical protein [Clostridiales bacterium]
MIKSVKNKNLFLSYTVITFVYMYSGVVEKYPDYNGNAMLTCFFTAACAAVYSFTVSKFFSAGFEEKNGKTAVRAVLAVFCVLYASSNVSFFARSLEVLDDFYASDFCMIFAAAFAVFCAVFLGKRGKTGVSSFCTLSVILFGAWTLFGIFAFFTAKQAVFISSPVALLSDTEFFGIVKDILYLNADLAVLAYVLNKNESAARKEILKAAIPAGAAAFASVSVINVLKNLLLFGDRLSDEAINPNFTAIRMIPLFDLPETCVIVNAFACVIKTAVFVSCAFFALKDIKGEKYNGKTTPVFLFAAVVALFFALFKSAYVEFFGIFGAVSCAALCFFLKYKNG